MALSAGRVYHSAKAPRRGRVFCRPVTRQRGGTRSDRRNKGGQQKRRTNKKDNHKASLHQNRAFLVMPASEHFLNGCGYNADMPDDALENTCAEVNRPADFGPFWHGVQAELADVPLEWERLPGAGGETAAHRIDWLRFSSLGDMLVYGWLAVPKKLVTPGCRGYLWLPGYSLGNPPPGPESLYPDTLTFGLNLHGSLPDIPYAHPSLSGADYITSGIESPPDLYLSRHRRPLPACLGGAGPTARDQPGPPDGRRHEPGWGTSPGDGRPVADRPPLPRRHALARRARPRPLAAGPRQIPENQGRALP